MKSEDFVEMLKELEMPVAPLEAISNIIQKPIGYTRLYVNRLRKKGIIDRVEGGLYCLHDTDEYTIASRIIPNSYITGYTALYHYGLTTQIPTLLQIIAPRYHRPLKLRNYTVKFSRVKKEFIYGYILTLNGPAFAEPEKIFVDDLYLHRRQYYSEEFEDAVRRKKIDVKKLKEYAIRSNDKAVVAMAGYYMEKFDIDASDLLPFKSKSYIKLNKRGLLNKRWRIFT